MEDIRAGRKLRDYQERLVAMQETNRRVLSELFSSGLIFSRVGARLGRDLLLAHQNLIKLNASLAQLGTRVIGRGARREMEALYAQAQLLLTRTSALSARSVGILARER